MKIFTVVGFYEDNAQPFVGHVQAKTPYAAVHKTPSGVTVVEVFEGKHVGALCNEELVQPDFRNEMF